MKRLVFRLKPIRNHYLSHNCMLSVSAIGHFLRTCNFEEFKEYNDICLDCKRTQKGRQIVGDTPIADFSVHPIRTFLHASFIIVFLIITYFWFGYWRMLIELQFCVLSNSGNSDVTCLQAFARESQLCMS